MNWIVAICKCGKLTDAHFCVGIHYETWNVQCPFCGSCDARFFSKLSNAEDRIEIIDEKYEGCE